MARQALPSLHHTPDTADFTEGDADFAKGSTACIPALVDNGDGATVPAASTPSRLTFSCQLTQKMAARLFRARIAGIIGQVQQIAQRQRDFMGWRLQRSLSGGRLLLLVLRRLWRLLVLLVLWIL